MPKIIFERLTAKEQEELNAGNTVVDNHILSGTLHEYEIGECHRMHPVVTSNAQCILQIPRP